MCIISFIVVLLGVLCIMSVVNGKSLEPVSMVVTGMFSTIGTIVGYHWGNSAGKNHQPPPPPLPPPPPVVKEEDVIVDHENEV